MSDLFRKQAVDHATRRLAGEVVLASPLSFKLLGGFFAGVIGAAVIFAALGSYARKETVPGWIVPQGGLIRLAARAGGVVEAIPAREGAVVAPGAPVVALRLSSDVASGDVGQALDRGISAEAAATAAQARASLEKLKAQRAEMASRGGALRLELGEAHSRIDTLLQRQKIAEDEVDRGEKLQQRGFLSLQQLDQLRTSALAASQDVSQTRAAALALERQIGDLNAEVAAVPADMAGVRAQAAQGEASLAQKRTTSQGQATFVATAPIAGRVVAVPVELGQSVTAGAAVAILTPRDSRLIAELYVPSRAAGFIQAGQEVRLMYQAFPYQTFGAAPGTVETVSRTVLAPSEIAIPGVTVQEPVFRVRVKLTSPAVRAYGRSVPLQPGMLLSADIVTDKRSLLQWLLDPLYAAGRRA